MVIRRCCGLVSALGVSASEVFLMRTVAIVQARMGSTRLPGKSAMLICGKPLVWHVLRRVKQSMVDEVILALPKEEKDNSVLAEAAADLGIRSITFLMIEPNDLIGRYTAAALDSDAQHIVRVPADNPCVDPDEINRIIRLYRKTSQGYERWLWSNLDRNIGGNGYPGGLGAEVYKDEFLFWLQKNVHDPRLREHPHMWAIERQRVATMNAHHEIARPELHFDVNTQEDLDYIRSIYEGLYPTNPDFRIRDILKFLGEQDGK